MPSDAPTPPSTPTRRPRDAELTRARVLESAEQLFARKGFDGTRLREVADAAQVTVPLVCHHFRDKDTLYEAVITRGLERFTDLGWDVLRRGTHALDQLRGFVAGLIDLAAKEPALTTILHREMADGGVRAKPLAERWIVPLKQAAVEALAAAQSRGEIRRGLDPDMLVLHIAGAVLYPCLAGPLVQAVWGADPQGSEFVTRRKSALLDFIVPLVQVG